MNLPRTGTNKYHIFFFKSDLPLLCNMFAVVASGVSVIASVTIPTAYGAVQSIRFQLKKGNNFNSQCDNYVSQ